MMWCYRCCLFRLIIGMRNFMMSWWWSFCRRCFWWMLIIFRCCIWWCFGCSRVVICRWWCSGVCVWWKWFLIVWDYRIWIMLKRCCRCCRVSLVWFVSRCVEVIFLGCWWSGVVCLMVICCLLSWWWNIIWLWLVINCFICRLLVSCVSMWCSICRRMFCGWCWVKC